MDANELRALADALLPMAAAPCFDGIDIERAAAYLRAQADAQPVAWLYRDWANVLKVSQLDPHEDGAFAVFAEPQPQAETQPAPAVPAGWKWVPVEPTPEMLSAVGMMDGHDWHAPGCSPDADHANWYSAMIAAAPAAPQAEPHRNQPLRDLLAVIHCDGGHHTEAVGIEQSIKDALSAVCVLKGKLAQAEPKREPLSDERITKGEYVLATKFSDGDPGDHWGVGFYDRLENGRHYIVDRAGQQIRGGGFRRAGRITVEVGIWLLSAAKSLEASPPGTVNLWTMLTERAHGIGGSDE